MENNTFRCRKCRQILFSASNLLTPNGIKVTEVPGLEEDDLCHSTLWYLDIDNTPPWVTSVLQEENYTRGKLSCTKCGGRVGAFDFVTPVKCSCADHNTPALRIAKNRVEIIRAVPITPRVNVQPRDPFPRPSQPQRNSEIPDTARSQALLDEDLLTASTENDLEQNYSSNGEDFQRTDGRENESLRSDSVMVERRSSLDCEEGDNVISGGATGCIEQPILENSDHNRCAVLKNEDEEEVFEDGESEGSGRGFLQIGVDVDAYTCPICLDIYYLPHRCHPCQHVFCSPCLRRLRGSMPITVRCPLCRQVICACFPHHELINKVKTTFPDEYKKRRSVEKKVRSKLPPLPSSAQLNLSNHLRGFTSPAAQGRNLILAQIAGVCFVALLIILAAAVIATTVAMVLWYLWELSTDLIIELVVKFNNFFDQIWHFGIEVIMNGNISPEMAKILLGSYGQALYAFGKLFNKTFEIIHNGKAESNPEVPPSESSGSQSGGGSNWSGAHYLSAAMQADVANYVLIMGFVTYLIYRLARNRLPRLEQPIRAPWQ